MKKNFTLCLTFVAITLCANAQMLLTENFDSGTLPSGWTTIDADGDNHTWEISTGVLEIDAGHNQSAYCIHSKSYANGIGPLTPDNYLITPAITLAESSTLTFWVSAQDASYPQEHYGVYISTTGTDLSDFTLLFEETINAQGGTREQGAWKQKSADLSAYTGQTIHIAFRHFNCTDLFYLNLDDVQIFAQPIDTLPYFEDFEDNIFPPPAWQISNTCNHPWAREYSDSSQWAYFYEPSDTACNEGLVTQLFDFSNYNNALFMDFDFKSHPLWFQNGTVDLKVYASTDGGNTYDSTPLFSVSQIHNFPSWTPTTFSVDLTSLAGQSNVTLKFNYEGSTCKVMIDNVHLYAVDAPIIYAYNATIGFYAEVDQSDTQTTTVVAHNLTEPITATTAAPFAVSADGITFATTATLPKQGGTLYIQYTGTLGRQLGTFTLSSIGSNNITFNVSGEGYDCTNISLPITEDFNHHGNMPACWEVVTAEGNTNTPFLPLHKNTSEDRGFAFTSMNVCDNYNQYLISPKFNTAEELSFSFEWKTTLIDYSIFATSTEHFRVGYSTTDNDVNSFLWIDDQTVSTILLDEYLASFYTHFIPATAKYIAINYYSEQPNYMLFIDNITIETANGICSHNHHANIYPNPTNNLLNITATSNIHFVEIFNMMGQKVVTFDAHDISTQINTTNLRNGIYTLRVNTENGVVVKKFTVAH